jgi:hypothetical protein
VRLGGLLGGVGQTLRDVRGGRKAVVDFTSSLPVCDVHDGLSCLANDTTPSHKLVKLVFDVEVTAFWLSLGCTTSSAPETTTEVMRESSLELFLELTLLLAESHARLNISIIV